MSEIDPQLEHRINRALDGELTDDERLALDRELLRCPAARRLMERSEALDTLAAETLGSVFAEANASGPSSTGVPPRPARGRYHRGWWLLPAAAAAAIAAALLVYSPNGAETGATARIGGDRPDAGRMVPVDEHREPTWSPSNHPAIETVPVSYRPRRVDRGVDRGVYGVRADDGSIYLIEVNHTRTYERPGGLTVLRPVGGDL